MIVRLIVSSDELSGIQERVEVKVPDEVSIEQLASSFKSLVEEKKQLIIEEDGIEYLSYYQDKILEYALEGLKEKHGATLYRPIDKYVYIKVYSYNRESLIEMGDMSPSYYKEI